VEKLTTQPNAPPVPNVVMSMKMAKALFESEKVNAVALANGSDVAPFELTQKNITVTIAVKSEHPMTQNVVAVCEGGDAVLKNEYVAVGAHYDHIGICAPGTPDPICNAADDDGSGTTGILGMAVPFTHANLK